MKKLEKTNKKLLIGLMTIVFLVVGGILAGSLLNDSIKIYDKNNKEYILTNVSDGNKLMAKIILNTPKNYEVGLGYQKVAEFTIINGERDYQNILENMEFYNIKDGNKEFVRDFDYKYKTINYVDVPIYEGNNCKKKQISANFSIYEVEYDCVPIQIRIDKREIIEWLPFINNSLIRGENITIGIFTEVKKGDYVEWIPTVYGGERLTEWASWTANLNTELVSYWKFDEGSGTNTLESISGIGNGTLGLNVSWSSGLINGSINFSGQDNNYVNITDISDLKGIEEMSVSLWFNYIGSIGSTFWIGDDPVGQYDDFKIYGSGDEIRLIAGLNGADVIYFTTTAENLVSNRWHHLVYILNSTGNFLYLNGTIVPEGDITYGTGEQSTSTVNFTISAITGTDMALIGSTRQLGPSYDLRFSGKIDEIGIWNRTLTETEISALYNVGSGISYLNEVLVAINSPAQNYNYTTKQIDFNLTVTGGNIVDSCLYSLDAGTNNITMGNISSTIFNHTNINVGQGNLTANFYCNSTTGIENFTESVDFFVDSLFPTLNNISITTTAGSKTINFNATINDTNLKSCKFSIYNSVGLIDGSNNNVSFICNNQTSAIVTDFATYNLTFYARDEIGNENSSSQNFTTTTSGGGGGSSGGGGGTTILQQIIETITQKIEADKICVTLDESLQKSFNEWRVSPTNEKPKGIFRMFKDFWNALTCRSASSIVSFTDL